MSGISMRLGQIFDESSGRAFVVAFDHGQALPIPAGLGDPVALMRRILAGGPEAVLVTGGMLAQTQDLFAHRKAPVAILRADWTTLDPRMQTELGERYRTLIEPREALALGAGAVCLYLIGWPEDGGMFADNVAAVASYVQRAHALGLPVIVEATLWGRRNADQKDPEGLRQMCRIAAELGADAIKTEFVGDVEAERVLIEEAGDVPVLTLGGAAASDEQVARAARDAIAAGARGLIFGRNVWQVPDMEATMARLSGIVHA
ncbi:class I fructose-bisphosphate aldolase [Schaalia naturae]|jgi:class I fructose-bisphosphate aldolase|uniref:Class I fructose-bisphosphate aldolase n=1 Tax=Schaalia naturae TaxID=635203 RepID=A0ABW2SJM0_9ACTO|nr:fructose-bisphosphate aldolase [Actinomyces sp.]MCI1641567.1 fructose-bisphosphate aldolase [Actinomyces sp.]